MELATNAEEAAKFVNGIIPNDVAKELPKNLPSGIHTSALSEV